MRRFVPVLAGMTMLLAGLPGGSAAAAPAEGAPSGSTSAVLLRKVVPLQPGAPMIDQHSSSLPYRGSYCTLNFVFTDERAQKVGSRRVRSTYIGTSANCTSRVGQRVAAPEIGTFGTVVFRDYGGAQFALIRVDPSKLRYVSKVVRGYGAAPSGYTTSEETSAGDPLLTHGYPMAGTGPSGVTRTGVLVSDTATGYHSTIQPSILDRGSPVVSVLDGKAFGISNEMYYPTGHSTIEGLLRLLEKSGLHVTL